MKTERLNNSIVGDACRTPRGDARAFGAPRHARTAIRWGLLAGLALALGPALVGAQERRASSRDYSTFELILDRNIFNPQRSARRSAPPPTESRRSVPVDTLALVGTMNYEKGPHAFFDGSRADFRKTVRLHDAVAGFTVTEIAYNRVRLAAGNQQVDLRVGSQLRREDDGPWRLSSREESFTRSRESSTSAPSTASTSTAGTAGESSPDAPAVGDPSEVSDVLKRLMQQREKELQ